MNRDDGHDRPDIAAGRADSAAERADAAPAPARRALDGREQPLVQLRAAREREFPDGAAELDELSRREFLQLAGVSVVALGLAACAPMPAEDILPYSRRPQDVVPGLPRHYATTLALGGYGVGLLVETYEGRPTKIEGNPDHPASLGATHALHQASLLQLYDPNRARLFQFQRRPRSRAAFEQDLLQRAAELAGDGGARLRFLVEPSASPTLGDLRRRIAQRFPEARFYAHNAVESENPAEGARAAFGSPLAAVYDFDRAEVILSLDSDFADRGPLALRYARAFSKHRTPGAGMNRFYAVESTWTPTGTLADHRLALRPSAIADFAAAVAHELASRPQGAALSAALPGKPRPLGAEAERFARAVAGDLAARAGRSLVIAGEGQPPAIHALAYAINAALGNIGATLNFVEPLLEGARTGPQAMAELAGDLRAGRVDTLVITAYNPAYSTAADLQFADALSRVPNSVYLGLYEDETAERAAWFAPALHPYETWGDARSADGTASLAQPLILPLYGGLDEATLLSLFLGQAGATPRDLLRSYWRTRAPAALFEPQWERWVADGVIPDTASAFTRPSLDAAAVRGALTPLLGRERGAGLELQFLASARVYDGRFANNAWLQELPEPITKLTWDNAALLSPRTARELGVGSGDVVRLKLREGQVEAPVQVLAGQADGCVTVTLGYGRRGAKESIAKGVGFDAHALRFADAPWSAEGLAVERTGRKHALAHTQHHWDLQGRPIALSAALADLQKNPRLLDAEKGPLPTLYEPVSYDEGHRWGMTVDMSRCTSCSACVVACQAENNIPVVGKKGVLMGREMHWLRIDRYFEGPAEAPDTVNQPMACVHCEKAPCEYVCPVNATVHSSEGLNEMVYNRCVGTRYCSNNCPYKVRRFNFLNYTAGKSPTEKMLMNPDVTVRGRGVMEKCTYCVQRIEGARIAARVEGRPIKDGEIVTACAQACPTEAIVFGDLNDPEARVSGLHRDPRRYDVLHEIGTRPRTGHLVRVKNLNPELA